MDSSIRRRRLGLTAKLIIPFVCIFVCAIAFLGAIFIRTQSAALSRSLDKKAEYPRAEPGHRPDGSVGHG